MASEREQSFLFFYEASQAAFRQAVTAGDAGNTQDAKRFLELLDELTSIAISQLYPESLRLIKGPDGKITVTRRQPRRGGHDIY